MQSYGNWDRQKDRKDGSDDSGLEIATLLVKSGHLADSQLTYAQRVKAKLLTPRTLVGVLLELGFSAASS